MYSSVIKGLLSALQLYIDKDYSIHTLQWFGLMLYPDSYRYPPDHGFSISELSSHDLKIANGSIKANSV